MIVIDNLTKTYDNNSILNDISLHVNKSEIFGIVGESGAGKSTLLRCISGLEKFDKGKLIVNNTDISKLTKNELRVFRRKIGMIFQDFALLSRKNVLQNVTLPMECWKYSKKEMIDRAEKLLDLVGLHDKKNYMTYELSGGQKQRVAIARALALDPDILLCDEATSALDPSTTESILELLKSINEKLGITIVMVTHEMTVIKSICDKMAIITDGKVGAEGSVKSIFLEEPPALQELIGRRKIAAESGSEIIKLSVENLNVKDSISYNFASELKVPFSIISANVEQFKDGSFGHFYLSVNKKYVQAVMDFFNSYNEEGVLYKAKNYLGGKNNVF